MSGGALQATVHGVTRIGPDLATKPLHPPSLKPVISISPCPYLGPDNCHDIPEKEER